MSLVCGNALTEEYAVIGVDLANENTYWKIKSINPRLTDDELQIAQPLQQLTNSGSSPPRTSSESAGDRRNPLEPPVIIRVSRTQKSTNHLNGIRLPDKTFWHVG